MQKSEKVDTPPKCTKIYLFPKNDFRDFFNENTIQEFLSVCQ